MDKATRIAKCKIAIEECETNLANFKNGKVQPQAGEVQSNKRALSLRREELKKLEEQQTTTV